MKPDKLKTIPKNIKESDVKLIKQHNKLNGIKDAMRLIENKYLKEVEKEFDSKKSIHFRNYENRLFEARQRALQEEEYLNWRKQYNEVHTKIREIRADRDYYYNELEVYKALSKLLEAKK